MEVVSLNVNASQRQYCNGHWTGNGHPPLFHGKKEYSVKYVDDQVVNVMEYSFFPWKKRVVTILVR